MKKKITVTVLLVFSLFTSISIYAATDIGEHFSIWYKDRFLKSIEEVESKLVDDIMQMQESTLTQQKKASQQIEERLKDYTQTSTAIAKESIENHTKNYHTRLSNTIDILKQTSYTSFLENEIERINIEIRENAKDILSEILGE